MKTINYSKYDKLTLRELQILTLLCKKITDSKKIGEILFISPSTVKAHLRTLYLKLDVSDKTQAVVEAFEKKIIDRMLLHFIQANNSMERAQLEEKLLQLY